MAAAPAQSRLGYDAQTEESNLQAILPRTRFRTSFCSYVLVQGLMLRASGDPFPAKTMIPCTSTPGVSRWAVHNC
eukprot:scaffold108417_cov18-Prasinocladus_malaysianus.AAC.1